MINLKNASTLKQSDNADKRYSAKRQTKRIHKIFFAKLKSVKKESAILFSSMISIHTGTLKRHLQELERRSRK